MHLSRLAACHNVAVLYFLFHIVCCCLQLSLVLCLSDSGISEQA